MASFDRVYAEYVTLEIYGIAICLDTVLFFTG
jgi:hypothetical protein